ncbi:MAG: ABC transporter permease [Gemmatimonadaceae bacterium]|nr:ABC transporter permease [Gemmatimonadaceae bacterium]
MSMRLTLATATLRRHPARTLLAILGIAVASALLLDMVMLATGMRESFRALLMTRGYQLRIAPKGTLPFDSEATIDGATAIITAMRASPSIAAVSPILGATVSLPDAAIPSTFVLGLEADVQGDYQLQRGADIAAQTTTRGVIDGVASAMLMQRLGVQIGDTLTIAAGLDAQMRTAARTARVVIRGEGRFFYVPT